MPRCNVYLIHGVFACANARVHVSMVQEEESELDLSLEDSFQRLIAHGLVRRLLDLPGSAPHVLDASPSRIFKILALSVDEMVSNGHPWELGLLM